MKIRENVTNIARYQFQTLLYTLAYENAQLEGFGIDIMSHDNGTIDTKLNFKCGHPLNTTEFQALSDKKAEQAPQEKQPDETSETDKNSEESKQKQKADSEKGA